MIYYSCLPFQVSARDGAPRASPSSTRPTRDLIDNKNMRDLIDSKQIAMYNTLDTTQLKGKDRHNIRRTDVEKRETGIYIYTKKEKKE